MHSTIIENSNPNRLNLNQSDLKRAPLSAFKMMWTPILFGETLSEVKQIERSIKRFGLIKPIIVSEGESQFVVIDGRRRLAAIRRMIFAGTLPRSLNEIPYILIDEAKRNEFHTATVLSAYEFYDAVMTLKTENLCIDDIADALYLSRRDVLDIISLSRLCAPIRKALFQNVINFDQARIYAMVPDEATQAAILTALGPFAKPHEILEAVTRGPLQAASNQFQLFEDNIVTLPPQKQNYVWTDAA